MIVDQREVIGGQIGRHRSKAQLKKQLDRITSFPVRFDTLNISDFCFVSNNRGKFRLFIFCLSTKCLVRVLIERKRTDDLAKSLKDTRYNDQKKRIKYCAALASTRPIYLIEQWVSYFLGLPNLTFLRLYAISKLSHHA